MKVDWMDIAGRVVFEDNHLLVVNKLPGEIVQGDKTGDVPLLDKLKAYIAQVYQKPGAVFLGLVHRLDRPVSGLVIFARTSKALARMNALMRDHALEKRYWAITAKVPPNAEGQLEHWLIKNEKLNKSRPVSPGTPGARLARLKYKLLASADRYHLVEIELLTGRHHQIRVQLAAMGCPIKGDLKYGYPRSNPDGSIHLHARELAFSHPVRQEPLRILAVPPTADKLWRWASEIDL